MFIRLVLLALSLTTVLVIGKCIYNLYFHPLKNYPGPFLARATRVYDLFYDLRGVSHWHKKELHLQYGDVVRIAPDELSYTNKEAWPTIYGFANKDGTGNFEKDPKFWSKSVNGVASLIEADDEGHKRMRRLQNPAFSDRALKAQESVIKGYADILVKQLHGQASIPETSTVDIVTWYTLFTFDVVGDLAFGESFHCLRNGEWHWWISAIFDLFKAATFLRAAGRFPQPFFTIFLLCVIPPKLLRTRKEQFKFSAERVNRRLESDNDRPDFMSYILKADDERSMSPDELNNASQLFIAAGSETTATALSGTTFLLLDNPNIFETLKSEIRGSFKEESEITIQTTAKLSYLNAVLEESLRICPPGPGAFPRQVPVGGRIVCGNFVAGGTAVGVHQLSINRSPLNFTDPDSFVPERWLGEEKYQSDKRTAVNPFSFGPRNCIGKNLAIAEVKLALSRVIWNFDMELAPESFGWLGKQKMLTTWKKEAMKVKLTSRF